MGLMTFRMLTGLDTPGFKLPSRIIKGIDPGWDDWVERCMEENPDDRFPTAVEMLAALSFREVAPAASAMADALTAFTIRDLGLELLWVKPGTFEMGSPGGFVEGGKDRDDDEALHSVTLTEGYWLGKHEVTQAQWERVMRSNPSYFQGGNKPVEAVSWTDVTSFCEKLTELERTAGRLPTGMAYQLPTEASGSMLAERERIRDSPLATS